MSSLEGKKFFISYAHDDAKYFEVFIKLFKKAIELHGVSYKDIWTDKKILTGEKWKEEIKKAIEENDFAIFLISLNSLTSKFIKREELPEFILKNSKDKSLIIPVQFDNVKIPEWEAINEFQIYRPTGKLANKYACFWDICFNNNEINDQNPQLVPYMQDFCNIIEEKNSKGNILVSVKKLDEGQNSNYQEKDFMFANRKQELEKLLSGDFGPYVYIDAPSNYGVKYLLMKYKKVVEEDWKKLNTIGQVILIDFNEFRTDNKFEIENIFKNRIPKDKLFISGAVNHIIFYQLDLLKTESTKKAFDTQIAEILNSVTPSLNVTLKIILSGRKIKDNWGVLLEEHKFKLFDKLTPFTVEVILNAINIICQTFNINPELEIKRKLATNVLAHSYGLPKCIAQILNDLRKDQMNFLNSSTSPNYYFKKTENIETIKKIVHTKSNEILEKEQLPKYLTYFFIARGLNEDMICEFKKIETISNLISDKSAPAIRNELSFTKLFDVNVNLFYDYSCQIERQLISDYIRETEPDLFIQINDLIIEYFDNYLLLDQSTQKIRDFAFICIEYLYHSFLFTQTKKQINYENHLNCLFEKIETMCNDKKLFVDTFNTVLENDNELKWLLGNNTKTINTKLTQLTSK